MSNLLRLISVFSPSGTAPVLSRYTIGDDFLNIDAFEIQYFFNLDSKGSETITASGIVGSLSENPTISDTLIVNNVSDESIGTIAYFITGNDVESLFSIGATIHVRPFVTNSAGLTSYGNDRILICGNTSKATSDYTIYSTEQIGTQLWTKFNWSVGNGVTAYYPNNDLNNEEQYGLLYDWTTANTLVPSGWHLPTKTEYQTLSDYLGGDSVSGGKLKETGTTYWNSPNLGGTNQNKLYVRGHGENRVAFKNEACLWSKTNGVESYKAITINFYYNGEGIMYYSRNKTYVEGVRFIKD